MRPSPRLKIGLIVVLLTAIFIILNLTGFSKGIKNFFYLISSPIQKTLWRAGNNLSDFFEVISEIKELKKENEELLLENQALLSENIRLEELKKENEILREALKMGLEKEFDLLSVEVIGKDVSQDTLLVSLGLKDGILKDFPVINREKALVGKIGEAYGNYSKVILISNEEITFDAKISDSEIYGLLKGAGKGEIFLDLVPREKEIKEGDLVVTAPLGGIFPKGLLVGEIIKVFRSDVKAWQEAEISPAFNLKELDTLFVITNFK